MKSRNRFCEREFGSLLVSGTLVNIILYVMNLSDTIIAGQFIGEAGIAAVNAVIPVTGVILFFAAFLSNGIGIIYPREIGAMRQ
ncbi:MAG: hypothetical protein K6G03_09125, partial [Lachnospiraceae bacterium]|nr:hypothetical protein [Lachnospiraceae bacterium]